MTWGRLLVIALIGLGPAPARAADTNLVLASWLAAQTNIQAWTATCVQTRTFKTLAQPLVSTGHVWYASPDRFRWELGQPPQTIAVRNGDRLTVIYPRLRRAEEYPLATLKSGPWRDALALLEAGFPRDRAQVDRQFRISSLVQSQDMWEMTMRPASSAARRFIAEVGVAFSTNDFRLRATELVFADGSRMRNEFRQPSVNQPVAPEKFNVELEPGTTVVRPLQQ